jgi:CDP-2,3-bis-(O-geranylgeranyl)-sn-glycerol synthase
MMRAAELLFVMLPAYCANMAAPFAKFWPGWNRPIHRRWLGDHKTVIGFVLGVAAATLTAYLQSFASWSPRGLDPSTWALAGFAQGVGAMGGDSVKSFFKRRAGIAPGSRWIPADQLDFVIGAMLFAWPWLRLAPLEIAFVAAFTFGAHIAVNHLAFRLGIRDTQW